MFYYRAFAKLSRKLKIRDAQLITQEDINRKTMKGALENMLKNKNLTLAMLFYYGVLKRKNSEVHDITRNYKSQNKLESEDLRVIIFGKRAAAGTAYKIPTPRGRINQYVNSDSFSDTSEDQERGDQKKSLLNLSFGND